MADFAPRFGIRQLLGLEPFNPQVQYFIRRPSRRSHSQLLPREKAAVTPLGTDCFGNKAALIKAPRVAVSTSKKITDAEENKDDEAAKRLEKPAAEGKSNGKAGPSGKAEKPAGTFANPADWTTEQGTELTRMKQSNSTWAQISTSLGKAQHMCKKRWKEIMPKDGQAGKPGGKETKDKKSKADGGNGGKQNQKGGDEDTMTSIYEFTDDPRQFKRLDVDDHFPAEVLQYAGQFDDDWYWLNMASRLFDKYGRRYTPQELKEKMSSRR